VESMEMAVESMEMALGAIPCLGMVSEQRLLSPEIGLRRGRRCGTLSGKTPINSGFSHQRFNIGRGATSEGTRGSHTTGWCGHLLAPLRLFFGLRLVSGENRNFGLCFVQFREYFPCNFSETQKSQKTENWHCGISSID
jgi:hypothetical protein